VTEPLVSATDFILAAETAVLAVLVSRRSPASNLQHWIVGLFACLSIASFAGGATHGFFLDEKSTGHAIFWPLSLIAIGGTAVCLAAIAAQLVFSPGGRRRFIQVVGIAFVGYVLVVLFVRAEFYVAIVAYVPAVLFLLAVLIMFWLARRERGLLLGITAIVLTLVASGIQQASFSIPGLPHANNVLYHAIEAVALLVLYRFFVWLEDRGSDLRGGTTR
jgi:hypothetical protein